MSWTGCNYTKNPDGTGTCLKECGTGCKEQCSLRKDQQVFPIDAAHEEAKLRWNKEDPLGVRELLALFGSKTPRSVERKHRGY